MQNHNKTIHNYLSILITDVIVMIFLASVSLILIQTYINASYIDTGYSDWLVQAFRVKYLLEQGFASWSQTWSNGMSIFQSYQFMPTLITAAFSYVTSISITNSMVYLTIIQFVGIRLLIYLLLRLLGINSFVSLFCSFVTLSISQYWGSIGDYSILFGFTVFPLLLFFWVKQKNNHYPFVFPLLVGLSFYIHPTLAFFTGLLWIIDLFLSEKTIISKKTLFEGLTILFSSSFFWFPLVFKNYAYSQPSLGNLEFVINTIGHYDYFGMSLILILLLIFCLGYFIISSKPQFKWAYILFVFSIVSVLLTFMAVTIDSLGLISKFQFTRGMTYVSIGIIFAVAPLIHYLYQKRSVLLIIITSILMIFSYSDSIFNSSVYVSPPGKEFTDPVASFIDLRKDVPWQSGRIWTQTIDVSSYVLSSRIRFPHSYMGHLESNYVSARLPSVFKDLETRSIIVDSDITLLNTYLKISATKYLFLDKYSTLAKNLPLYGYKSLGIYESKSQTYEVFEVPFVIREAVAIDESLLKQISLVSVTPSFEQLDARLEFDSNITQFTEIIYDEKNVSLPILYESNSRLKIDLINNPSLRVIYLNQSYSQGWSAYLDGKKQKIEATGPNYLKIFLDSEGSTLIVKHEWPVWFYVSIIIVLNTIVSVIFVNIHQRYLFKV